MKALIALVISIQSYLVLCDDCSPNSCPTSTTCCPTDIPGMVGCCPSPNAVCCSDRIHCCPQNTSYNLDKGTCDNKTLIPLSFRKPDASVSLVAIKEAKRLDNVYCPDGRSCPDTNTCCKRYTGEYECCQYPSAMCCNDERTCCPSGTICAIIGHMTYCKPSSLWNITITRDRYRALTLPVVV